MSDPILLKFINMIIQFFKTLLNGILKLSCSSDRSENKEVCAGTQFPEKPSGAERLQNVCRLHIDTYSAFSPLPENIEKYTFHKDITVLVIGKNDSGKRSLIDTYDDVKRINRFYFPSENIRFIRMNLETFRPCIIEPDVIWFVVNYLDCTHDKDFKILQECFPQIPVIIVLNKVDQLQNFPGHAFDLIATKQLPDCLKTSSQLTAMQKRYQLLRASKSFLLSQMMLTSMRIEERNDRPVGLLGLYQATLNCMDDKQFDRLEKTTMTEEVKDFLKTVKEIKRRKKNSWGVVLICGSSNNGKSTLINNLFKKNVTQTGLDGTPTTTTLQIFSDESSKVLYIDSAGLEKHDNTDKFVQLTSIRPDLIWLILNYTSSIEETELDISKKYFPNTPLILIINKVDILQQLNVDQTQLNNFDQFVPNPLKEVQHLMSVRDRLIKHQNAHRLVLLSLREDEENDKPIGLTNLLDITTQYFNSRTNEVILPSSSKNNMFSLRCSDGSVLVRRKWKIRNT